MYIALQRIMALIEDCSNGSRMWLLMNTESFAEVFHELTLDLWTLLEILPSKDLKLSEDIEELKALAIKQCCEDKTLFVDPSDNQLRIDVLNMLDSISKEIVPDESKLAEMFDQLGLSDSASCREEIEFLEDEAQCQSDDKSKSTVIALIGLVRYAKCVLFGASSPGSDIIYQRTTSDLNIPADFQCPITLEIMRDPVVVATGQTYDRSSITHWIESGHNTCPRTGQTLAHTNLIPNKALKNLIAMWCREQRIPFAAASEAEEGGCSGVGMAANKAALEVTKMTVSFLVNKLSSLPSEPAEAVDRIVYELRILAKRDSDCRDMIGDSGAISLLIRHLVSEDPSLQVNAVTTILNLSILDENKVRIMETDGAVNGVIDVLRSGATWEAKGNAAMAIYSISGLHQYKKKLGRKTRVIKGLFDLARVGPTGSKKDALVAILSLAGDREAVGKMVECGAVEVMKEVVEDLPEEAAAALELVVKRGGVLSVAAAAAAGMIGQLTGMLRSGTGRTRESAASTLVIMCRRGGSEVVAELARTSGIEMAIWDLMGTGSSRAKRKAASLMRSIQRWAAGLEVEATTAVAPALEVENPVTVAFP